MSSVSLATRQVIARALRSANSEAQRAVWEKSAARNDVSAGHVSIGILNVAPLVTLARSAPVIGRRRHDDVWFHAWRAKDNLCTSMHENAGSAKIVSSRRS